MELPKVNIALAGSAVIAICSTLGGGVWYMSQQASVIEALQSDLEKLTVENSAVDRTNLIRDVQANSEKITDIVDYIVEVEDEGGETIDDIETDMGETRNITDDTYQERISKDLAERRKKQQEQIEESFGVEDRDILQP